MRPLQPVDLPGDLTDLLLTAGLLAVGELVQIILGVPANRLIVTRSRSLVVDGALQNQDGVTRVHAEDNLLTVLRADGTERTHEPRRQLGVTVYRELEKAFSVGDRSRRP